MAQVTRQKSPEELREERRRARWQAFWTPFITLASIVASVGLLMFFARACRERFPQFTPPGTQAPMKNQPTVVAPGGEPSPAPQKNRAGFPDETPEAKGL